MHPLNNKWIFWAHLPHDIDWSLKSYSRIMNLEYVEEMITLTHTLPDKLVTNCMLFFMRDGVNPVWEDPKNKGGGCFSYKIVNKSVVATWADVWYQVAGESLSDDAKFNKNIMGISISPKKGFCILKVWMTNCEFQSPSKIASAALPAAGCIFKRHLDH